MNADVNPNLWPLQFNFGDTIVMASYDHFIFTISSIIVLSVP